MSTIEADRLDTPLGLTGRNIRSGVEIDPESEMPRAYWIAKRHPGDELFGIPMPSVRGKRKFRRVPSFDERGRRQVFHIYTKKRAGQSRGHPWFAPVLNKFKDYSDYEKAEVIAAKISACVALIVTRDGTSPGAPFNPTQKGPDGESSFKLFPGATIRGGPGQKVDTFNPARPNANLESFTIAMIRSIAGAVGIPYEIALRDFSKTTWSSARASVIEARRMFVLFMLKMARGFLQPIWEMLMEEAWMRGEIRHVRDFRKLFFDWTKCKWNGAGWEWVDPKNEAAAAVMRVEKGLSTMEEEIRRRSGSSFEAVVAQRVYEKQVLEKAGLIQKPPDTGEDPDEPDPDPDPENEDPEDEEEQEDGEEQDENADDDEKEAA